MAKQFVDVAIYDGEEVYLFSDTTDGLPVNFIYSETEPENPKESNLQEGFIVYYIAETNQVGMYANGTWQLEGVAGVISDISEITASSEPGSYVIVKDDEETPTKKFTRLYLGETAYSSNGKRFRKLQTEEYVEASEGLEFISNGDGTCYVSGIGTLTDETIIVIPSVSPDGERVTQIGSFAFDKCDSLVEVIIPDSVRIISNYAFWGCTSLTKIEIPDTVTIISNGAFRSCSSLTDVQLPKSLNRVGQEAFSQCTKLESIIFEGTVEQWNSIILGVNWASSVAATYVECIDGKVWLRNQPEGLYDAYGNLVASWDALVNTYGMDCEMDYSSGSAESNYYADVSSSPYCVLTNNSELTDCTELIVGDIATLGECAFYGCTSLKKIYIPWGINTISDYAFYGCHSLTSIPRALSIKNIGCYAFAHCISLIDIGLPNSLECIESEAFIGCVALTKVTMPKTVKRIGENAFRNCASYFEIYFGGTKAEWEAILKGDNWKPSDKTVYVACTDGVLEM